MNTRLVGWSAASLVVLAVVLVAGFWPDGRDVPVATLDASHEVEPQHVRVASAASVAPPQDRDVRRAAAIAAADDRGFGSLQIRVWFGKGDARRPAADVPVVVRPSEGVDVRFGLLEQTTSAHGEVLVANVPAGRALVHLGRKLPCWKQVHVRADGTTQVDLELAHVVCVAGTVVDERSYPIAGATVEAMAVEGGERARPVAITDEHGRFEVRGLPEIGAIGARAPGFLAAQLRFFEAHGEGESRREVRIVLAHGGASVHGVVRGADQQPVRDAVVLVGAERPHEELRFVTLADGSRGFDRAAIEARTDERGEFSVFGLPAGDQLIRVRAANHRPWTGSCAVSQSGVGRIAIHLEDGAVCEGVVQRADGSPASGCRVWSDTDREFFRSEVMTDRDGRYRLTGLMPGPVTLRAERHRERAKVDLVANVLQPARWSPQLESGVALVGRVVTDQGRPIANASIEVMEDRGTRTGVMDLQRSKTDADGRFRFDGVESGPVLYVTLLAGVQQPLMRARVDATAGDCVFKIPDPGPRTGTIMGRIGDASGAHVDGVAVHLEVAGSSTRELAPDPLTGEFVFEALFKGPYTLRVQAPGHLIERIPIELGEGEQRDAGRIELCRSGWVSVDIADVPLDVRARLSLVLRREGTASDTYDLDCMRSPARSVPVRPGTYTLEVSGDGIAAARQRVVVQSGAECRAVVPIRAGLPCRIRVRLPAGAGTEDRVWLTIRSANETTVDRLMPNATGLIRPFSCCLSPGAYTVEARVDGLGQASGTLRVVVGEPQAAVELSIRQ